MWTVGILCVLLVIVFLFGEVRVAARNASIRRLRAQLEWEKKRSQDLEWNVGCFEGAYNRQEEHMVGLEAELRSLKRNDATSAGPRSSITNPPATTKRQIMPTRLPTPGIAKPSTDLANLPGRPAFTGHSASGTKPPSLPPIFPSIIPQTYLERKAGPMPSIFGPTLPQTTTQNDTVSRPSLFGTSMPKSNTNSQPSIFASESAPRPGFGLFGGPLIPSTRPTDSVPPASALFGNNPFDPSSTGTRSGFNIVSGEPPITALNRTLSEGRSMFDNSLLLSLPSSLLSLEQLEEIKAAKHREDQKNAQ